jgi:LmbE family N-acetylglucosaminyl deacetylase
MRPTTLRALLAALLAFPVLARAADLPPTPSGPAILQNLKSFQQMATVLMVAAHPDDENTGLITYLARGRGYRMAYLSVTRGDGGQNLLGPEFGEELGLIRTYELLAARNLDQGRQFFTRAIDFGYSKSPDETLRIWDRAAVLGDVVRVLRTFRPDVVVARFSTATAPGQHGHHTASAILAGEAFKLAGDPNAYPEQLQQGLTPWQPKRIFLNGGGGGRGGAPAAPGGPTLTMNSAGTDPLLNQTYGQIAGQSRAMHKSQGVGGGLGGGQESFRLLDGDPATTDIMDGIDTTWARVSGNGSQIARLVADAVAQFDPGNPSASVPALLAIKKLADGLPTSSPPDPILTEKRRQLDRLIADCLGLTVQTTIPDAQVTPGGAMPLTHTAQLSASIPVKWTGFSYPLLKSNHALPQQDMKPNAPLTAATHETLPANTPVSQPYWLQQDPAPGIYRVSDPTLIGRPINLPVFPVEFQFEVSGQTLRLADQPVQLFPNAPAPQARRPLEVIAPVSIGFAFPVALFHPSDRHPVNFEMTAAQADSSGTFHVDASAGWKVEPAAQPFTLGPAGSKITLTVNITAPATATAGELTAHATVAGVTYGNQRKEIAYDHIPHLLLQPPAKVHVVALDLQHKGALVGYLPGAGDATAEALQQIGYQVKELTGKDLTPETLQPLDAVVIGVRAFNTRTDLSANLQNLFTYASNGGTVIEQYNRPDQLRNTTLAPYPLTLSAQRVTDENAPVTFLAPDSPALTTPNKITAADFANWIQERNIYLPTQFAPEFQPILAMADPGETPPNSSLLIAQHGKGYFVYTTLVFFRQLPAANPGAYRLFANLLSLGKP